MTEDDAKLLSAVRQGDSSAWEKLIIRYEGRLLAFACSRLHDSAAAEDVVQETFLGFLLSLPNYDETTSLESFLFAITAHKLTDALRKMGRRPRLLDDLSDSGTEVGSSKARKASSMARSREGHVSEQKLLGQALKTLIQSWISRGEFERLQCVELLFVSGLSNKEVAERLGVTEQAVANHKSFVVGKLNSVVENSDLNAVNWSQLRIPAVIHRRSTR